MKLQKALFPSDHPDITRTLHNLALIEATQENIYGAEKQLSGEKVIADQKLYEDATILDEKKHVFVG